MKVIDVSKWNGKIEWDKVKASGIEGVIIRAGYGCDISQKDKSFEEYYKGAKQAGLHIGSYWFSYALTEEAVAKEASVFLEAIKGKQFDLPVYFDIETIPHTTLSKLTCGSLINKFCSSLEKVNYFVGVYSFDTFFFSNIPEAVQKRFASWVARVENVKPSFVKNYGIWQHSWKGKVDGISGDVDMNICYKDYPTLIKGKGLNGFGNAPAKYTVTSRIAELSIEQATKIAEDCKRLGMSAIIAEQ